MFDKFWAQICNACFIFIYLFILCFISDFLNTFFILFYDQSFNLSVQVMDHAHILHQQGMLFFIYYSGFLLLYLSFCSASNCSFSLTRTSDCYMYVCLFIHHRKQLLYFMDWSLRCVQWTLYLYFSWDSWESSLDGVKYLSLIRT